MARCECGLGTAVFVEFAGKKYCQICLPRCHCCGDPMRAGVCYVKTEWGIVCPNCFNPALVCFTCGIQLASGKELRLADHRVSCAACAATAVYRVDKDLVCAVKRHLAWFPQKHISFGTVDVRRLHAILKVKGGTAVGLCDTAIMRILSFSTVLRHRILILFGLPLEMCQAALVHELFHAWLNENVPAGQYSSEQAEWLCEHMAFDFLRSIKAQKHWLARVEASRDQYHEVRGLKHYGQSAIIRELLD